MVDKLVVDSVRNLRTALVVHIRRDRKVNATNLGKVIKRSSSDKQYDWLAVPRTLPIRSWLSGDCDREPMFRY